MDMAKALASSRRALWGTNDFPGRVARASTGNAAVQTPWMGVDPSQVYAGAQGGYAAGLFIKNLVGEWPSPVNPQRRDYSA
jgi:hypothetical protein